MKLLFLMTSEGTEPEGEPEPFDVGDLVEPRLRGAQSSEQSAAGPELGDEVGEGRPLGGLEAPAEADQRPQPVLRMGWRGKCIRVNNNNLNNSGKRLLTHGS